MLKILTLTITLSVMLFTSSGVTFAYTYYVRGYTRSNGTYVNGYYKTSPNYYNYDNYSYRKSQPLYNSSYYKYPRPSYNYSNGIRVPQANRVYSQFESNVYNNMQRMRDIGNSYSRETNRINE